MANLSIPDDLAEQLQKLAQEENRSVEELLASMVDIYSYRSPKLQAMSDTTPDNLVERLQQLVQEEQHPLEEVIASMVEIYLTRLHNLMSMCGMFDCDITDMSTTVRETMEQFYKDKADYTFKLIDDFYRT